MSVAGLHLTTSVSIFDQITNLDYPFGRAMSGFDVCRPQVPEDADDPIPMR